jgi:type II secretory pathway component PulF
VIISIILFVVWYKNTDSGKKTFDTMFLDMPLVWNVYRNFILANVAANLWTLFASWIPITKTLKLTWRATNNYVYNKAFEEINLQVSKWNKIVDSMMSVSEEEELFPADFLQMLSVWERTATIDKISKKINDQYTREVQTSLEVLTKWIEPIAILIAWVFVLWFAFAIFWAILKVTQTL